MPTAAAALFRQLAVFAAFIASTTALGACASTPEPSEDSCDSEESCAAVDKLSAADVPFTLKAIKKAKYPIILHHGFNASTTNSWSFYKVKEALEKDGQFVVLTEVQPLASVETRAKKLAPQIDAAIAQFCTARQPGVASCAAGTKVNIVAHSMGGLDSRYLISTLGYGAKVASLTTLSTPHGGTALADVMLDIIPDDAKVWKSKALSAAATWYGGQITTEELAQNPDFHGALSSLAIKNMPAFDKANPDDSRVLYQSWAGVSRAVGGPRTAASQAELLRVCDGKHYGSAARADFMTADLIGPSQVVGHFGSEFQDGMTTVASAKHGIFLGCYPADHMQEVGQKHKEQPDAYTGFDHLVFFRQLATELAARGL